MPIDKRKSVGDIIKQEKKAGRPQKQAVAIALKAKGKSKEKAKGISKESVEIKPFDTLVNEYLNAFIFEEIAEPISQTLVAKKTDEVKKGLMQRASKINPTAVRKAMQAAIDAGMDK